MLKKMHISKDSRWHKTRRLENDEEVGLCGRVHLAADAALQEDVDNQRDKVCADCLRMME